MSRKPTPNIDYTSRDYEGFRELLINKLQEKMPEYTDTSETDAGIVIIEALANGLDVLSLYLDIVANDVILPTTQSRRMAVLIANCLGYFSYNQTTSEYEQVFVLSAIRDEDTIIPKGTVVKTKDDNDLVTLYYETKEDLIIPNGALGNETDHNGNYLYHVTVQGGTSIYQDVIGSSSGAPLQSFVLNYKNVLVDSLNLFVDEGNGEELWLRVDTFFESDENSKVYTVIVDEFDNCTVQFGNGLKGKIPTSFPNGIIANYRIGGGEASNVSAGVINTLDTGIAFVDRTFNLKASVLGHDKETLDSIKQNAPASYRSRDRLVTLEDYEDLLRINFYDFLDVQAVRDEVNLKHVHLFYMLRTDRRLTDELVKKVTEFISKRQMIGTSFDLAEYTKEVVNFTVTMYYDKDYDKDELCANVKAYLMGATFNYDNMTFDDDIVKSELEYDIKSAFEGIVSLRITAPTQDIIKPSSPEKVLTLGSITINTIKV